MKRRCFQEAAWAAISILAVGLLTGCVYEKVKLTEKPAGVRFGLVADSHYADVDPVSTRPFRESLPKMKECVEVMNRERLDFLIELGDFKDRDRVPNETKTLSYLRRIESVFGQFQGPRYHVLGNHDMDNISKTQFLNAVENTGIPKKRSFYRFDERGLRFLVLDANFDSGGKPYDHGRFDWADCNMPRREIRWLKSELAASPKPVIIFIHQQLDGEGDYYVKNAAAVRGILETSGKVLAVFQGHRHEGAYSRMGGIHYYTLKGMVEGSGPENNSYAVVEVDPNCDISVTGFRKADSLKLLGTHHIISHARSSCDVAINLVIASHRRWRGDLQNKNLLWRSPRRFAPRDDQETRSLRFARDDNEIIFNAFVLIKDERSES